MSLFSDLEKSKKAILAARLALEKTSIGVSLEEKPSDDAAARGNPANSENNASDTNNISSNEGQGGNLLPDNNNAGRNEDAKGAESTGR